MNKGLEIINFYEDSNYLNTFHPNFMKDLQIVKKDLQRLETIDNANPSEALEFIKMLLDVSGSEKHFINLAYCDTRLNLIKIKQSLLKAQEQEKENAELKRVLEIIKNKCVDIQLLKRSENWLDYYTRFKHRTGKNTEITQEEFDLLKRYLNDN